MIGLHDQKFVFQPKQFYFLVITLHYLSSLQEEINHYYMQTKKLCNIALQIAKNNIPFSLGKNNWCETFAMHLKEMMTFHRFY